MRTKEFDAFYMKVAYEASVLSRCIRKQVGAVIVKDGNIIAFGYNGTPAGFENECECEKGITKDYVLHAEANAILKVAKNTLSSKGGVLYTTLSPCVECSKLIIQADISRVVYMDEYKCIRGLELLKRAGILTEQF